MAHRQKKTLAKFIADAIKIHGNKYDYSQSVYVGAHQKIKIICSMHGAFEQMPSSHTGGTGCLKCSIAAQSFDTAIFIEAAQKKHGTRYDYSQAVYQAGKQKIKIICPEHGLFEQAAAEHMAGKGCNQCAVDFRGRSRAHTTQYFIERSRAKHGTHYGYLHVAYQSSKSKVKIICPAHGLFEQVAGEHMTGKGCRLCARSKVAESHRSNTELFITRARAQHGERYDYSQTEYLGSKLKVKIICPSHGLFEQTAKSHLNGSGCQKCSWIFIEEINRKNWPNRAGERTGILYLVRIFNEEETFYKVGVTCKSVDNRFKYSLSQVGYNYEIVAQHSCADAARVHEWEQSILDTFKYLRYRPKRYFAGETECFSSCDEILAIFPIAG